MISVIKRQVFQSYFQSLAEALALTDAEMIESFSSEDLRKALAHFVRSARLLSPGADAHLPLNEYSCAQAFQIYSEELL